MAVSIAQKQALTLPLFKRWVRQLPISTLTLANGKLTLAVTVACYLFVKVLESSPVSLAPLNQRWLVVRAVLPCF